jgi:hypothetical protein
MRAAISARLRIHPACDQPSITFSTTVIASISMKCWWIIATTAAIASAGRWPERERPRNRRDGGDRRLCRLALMFGSVSRGARRHLPLGPALIFHQSRGIDGANRFKAGRSVDQARSIAFSYRRPMFLRTGCVE